MLPPAERKKYSKTKPIQYEEFEELKTWWNNREENVNAWKVNVNSLIKTNEQGVCYDLNLDVKNPNRKSELEYKEPSLIIETLVNKEKRVLQLMKEIESLISVNSYA